MRIYAGVDIGSVTTKTALIDAAGELVAFHKIATTFDRGRSGSDCLAAALAKAGAQKQMIAYLVSTGYGRRTMAGVDHTIPEIICHSRGTAALFPDARTIIDIGGQDSKVIALDSNGNTFKFEMNDKCAAGTGRFLEVLTDRILNIDIDTLGPTALQAQSPCVLSSMCTVFAETEIVSLLSESMPVADIAQGMHLAIAKRVVNMGRAGQIAYRERVVFSGGVAKNVGALAAIEEVLGQAVDVPAEPQITAALGAALFGRDRSGA